jgi:hypothetical protein
LTWLLFLRCTSCFVAPWSEFRGRTGAVTEQESFSLVRRGPESAGGNRNGVGSSNMSQPHGLVGAGVPGANGSPGHTTAEREAMYAHLMSNGHRYAFAQHPFAARYSSCLRVASHVSLHVAHHRTATLPMPLQLPRTTRHLHRALINDIFMTVPPFASPSPFSQRPVADARRYVDGRVPPELPSTWRCSRIWWAQDPGIRRPIPRQLLSCRERYTLWSRGLPLVWRIPASCIPWRQRGLWHTSRVRRISSVGLQPDARGADS